MNGGPQCEAYKDEDVVLYHGDCVDVMKTLDVVDAIVTDPPYGLEFMGKEWDKFKADAPNLSGTSKKGGGWDGRKHEELPESMAVYLRSSKGLGGYVAGEPFQAWCYTWALEAYRVLKPGGHMVCFGGTRTFHRLTCAVEDAGFEIRDCLMWLYGSGFPKSLDVSKAIDKAAGAKREVVAATGGLHKNRNLNDDGWAKIGSDNPTMDSPEPITDAAHQWQGWGTALKPSWEPILLCRKPLTGTVAHNVQKHGTGALNVDATRIGIESSDDIHAKNPHTLGTIGAKGIYGDGKPTLYDVPLGRWPANLVLDEESARMLDAQSGESAERSRTLHHHSASGFVDDGQGFQTATHGDSGGASRFFYTSKAGPDERAGSKHPTVKPRDLMLWLCKLITPPGGLILDPFIGSGTTAVAARMGGFKCIGIDNNEEYLAHAAERLRLGDAALCEVNEARKHGAEQGTLL